jgi:hypothetical protein
LYFLPYFTYKYDNARYAPLYARLHYSVFFGDSCMHRYGRAMFAGAYRHASALHDA